MAGRKLTPEELAGAEDLGDPAPPTSGPRKLSPEELAGAVEVKPAEPGFFRKAGQTIWGGLNSLGHVAAEQLPVVAGAMTSPIDTIADPEKRAEFVDKFVLTNPAKRRELERGLSDTVTAGYAQKLGEYVDKNMNEEFPSISERHMAPDQVVDDAVAAPGYRTAGSVLGMGLANPLGNAMGFLGKTGGAVAERVAPQLVAKGLGYVSKVPGVARDVAGSVANYEAVAPLTAAVAAVGEEPQPGGPGRLEAAKRAAKEAALDPMGLGLSVGGAAAGSAFKRGVLGSKGGKARALIDSERSGGAHAGLLTPGKGGVFAEELKGLGTDDAAIGRAAQIGGQGIVSHLEGQHAAEHGYDYREGPDLVRQVRADRVDAIRRGETEASAAGRDAREEIRDVNEEARLHAHGAAPELLADLNERHRIEGSEPYRVLKEQIDNSPAAFNKRDITPVIEHLQDAQHYLGTPDDVKQQIAGLLKELDTFRDPILGGPVMVPEWQLNGLRRKLSGMGNVGAEVPRGHDAALAKAAGLAREMVDQGPYAPLNKLFAESASALEAGREGLGLKGRRGSNPAAEEAMVKARMVRSVKDPTAFPGEGPPPGADMGPYRQRIQDAEARRLAAEEAARTTKAEVLAKEADTAARVARGTEAAIPDRTLLGLNENIGQRAVDENQVGIALERQVRNSTAAGRNRANLPAFREKYPSQGRNIDLPVLQNARSDLSFRIKPKHGGAVAQAAGEVNPALGVGLMATKHPLVAALLAAAQNKDPIMGRVLYRPAKALKVQNIARALGAARGADLGQKAEAYIELQKGQGQ